MRLLIAAATVLVLAGCASAPPPSTQAGAGKVFVGEVWTWDEPNNVVTLYDAGRTTRVKITPDQMRTLRLHERTRVTGELAPPADMLVVTNTGPRTPVPKGQPESMDVQGKVATVDPAGRIAVTSDRGPVHVWAASGADHRFSKGAPVSVQMTVQPVDMVPVAGGAAAPTSPNALTSASPSSEPGDHAVVTGRIIGINPGGVLVVESPTGPIQVLVRDGSKYKIGDFVQVHTTLRTTS
jgi:hypothetical protein